MNTVRIDGGYFVVFFETTLPRISKHRFLLNTLEKRALLRKSCLGMVAISNCAKHLQVASSGPNPRMKVLHPPQEITLKGDNGRWNHREPVRFCFLGRDFARKGGIEMLRAFDALVKLNWHLTIISSLSLQDYATQYTRSEQAVLKAEVVDILERRKGQIKVHDSLPNNEVLEVMLKSHVGLLPTWHDTYGYSVLEFQASGCPVISTDVRALPEINNNDCGWVVPVCKKHGAQISPLKTSSARQRFSEDLTKDFKEVVSGILNGSLDDVRSKSQAAIQRIKSDHDPLAHKAALLKILSG